MGVVEIDGGVLVGDVKGVEWVGFGSTVGEAKQVTREST